jgi:hypothetical protein
MRQTNPLCPEAFRENSNSKKPRYYVARAIINLTNVNLLSSKTNFIDLMHQADLQINGKTIESTQPYINISKHFQMLSEMSFNDVATVGHSFGFGETIDNHRSVVWIYGSAANNANGNIFTNNRIFSQTPSVTGAVSAVKYVSPAYTIHKSK